MAEKLVDAVANLRVGESVGEQVQREQERGIADPVGHVRPELGGILGTEIIRVGDRDPPNHRRMETRAGQALNEIANATAQDVLHLEAQRISHGLGLPNVFDAEPRAPLGAPVGSCVELDGISQAGQRQDNGPPVVLILLVEFDALRLDIDVEEQLGVAALSLTLEEQLDLGRAGIEA